MNAPGLPALLRRHPGLAMRGEVVDLPDEEADRLVQLGQGEPGLPGPVRGAARRVPGQRGQAHLVDGAENPLHLAPAARLAGQGEVGPNPQVGHHLGQVGGGEVRAVVDVERAGDAAHVPAGPGLAPDRLPERQRGGQRRRGAQVDRVPGDGPGVVVLDEGQPRPARPARRGEHPQVQQGVVGLPDLVRLGRLSAVHQVEHLLVPLGCPRARGWPSPGQCSARCRTPRRSPAPASPAPGPPRPPAGARWRSWAAGGAAPGPRSAAAARRASAGFPCPSEAGAPARPGLPRGMPPASGAASARARRARRPRGPAGSRPRGGRAAPASGQAPAPVAPRPGPAVQRARYQRQPPHGAVFLFRAGAVRMVTVPQPWKWNASSGKPRAAAERDRLPFRKLVPQIPFQQ